MKRIGAALAAFAAFFALGFFAAWDVPLGAWDPPARFLVGFLALYAAIMAYILSAERR